MSDDYYEEEFIDQVRYNNDLLNLASEYTNLSKRGKNYMGLCPFHNEDTASFSVDSDKQLYYCFGCGVGGNIFNFIMEVEGLTFVEAIEYLADRANIDLPEQDLSAQEKKRRSEKQKLYEIHKLATRFYSYLLVENELGEQGYEYLRRRGFTEEIIQKFNLGFAPNRWGQLYKFLQNKGYSDTVLEKSGLVIPRKNSSGYYDRFRNRVIFSIFNHRGQPIGFGGRVLDDDEEPKYLNSPETMIFDKSRNLYGLHLAKPTIRDQEEAIIMEGYTDVITAYQAGIKNVVASLGTSLTKNQAQLLARYAEKAYIAYDADAAGEQATWRGLDILRRAGLLVKVIELPADEDPDDFIAEKGVEAFNKLKEQAVPLIEFKLNSILADREINSIEDKIAAVQEVLPVLGEIEDEIERNEYLELTASRLNVDTSALQKEYSKFTQQNSNQSKKGKNWEASVDLKEELNSSPTSGYTNAIEGLLKIAINYPEYIPQIKEKLPPKDFEQQIYRQAVDLIYTLYEQEAKLDVDDLLAEIDDEELRKLIVKLSVDEVVGSHLERELTDYIKKIKEHQLKMKLEELETKIKQAEAEGDNNQLMNLLQDYQQYQNQLRKEGN